MPHLHKVKVFMRVLDTRKEQKSGEEKKKKKKKISKRVKMITLDKKTKYKAKARRSMNERTGHKIHV